MRNSHSYNDSVYKQSNVRENTKVTIKDNTKENTKVNTKESTKVTIKDNKKVNIKGNIKDYAVLDSDINNTTKNIMKLQDQEYYMFRKHYRAYLNQRIKELENIIAKKEKVLDKRFKGNIKASGRNGSKTLYIKLQGDKKYRYLRKDEKNLGMELSQNKYDIKILNLANKEKDCLMRTRKALSRVTCEELYEYMGEAYKDMIIPINVTDEEYVNRWLDETYVNSAFPIKDNLFVSKKGEVMRSKSEVLIADMLYSYGIPYKYEVPVMLEGLGTVHPDFCCLNVNKRKSLYWEHMGMMDDDGYRDKNLYKIRYYNQNGYNQGEDIIYTFESSKMPLSIKEIEGVIHRYFLDL